ncbi:acyl-coenzyme A diphosphatase NUDT19-like [Diadema antillarum]|uniref:acyl-coenzyme A diphosphatase NUDT19-like n=1 Tax=Diadema antillarum TaxID=105358 RepID=UPI003A8B05A8
MASGLKYWREAATLILAARVKSPITSYLGNRKFVFDYQILMLQRSAKSGFFPSAQVFPGGTVEKADFSSEWLGMFRKYANVQAPSDFGPMVQIEGKRPPMFLRDHGSELPPAVAYRISAIRETFEECGILMLRDASQCRTLAGVKRPPLGASVTMAAQDLRTWRERIHKDAGSFLSLCQELQSVPDIWSLEEWSNWLTPSDMMKKRFDTIFFISCLDHLPVAVEDNAEISQCKWITPLESLQLYSDGVTYLPPPQVYEYRRLLNKQRFDDLAQFCQNRAFQGMERFLPVRCNCSNGVASLFPGDEYYPEHPAEDTNEGNLLHYDGTVEDHTQSSAHTNRILFHSVTDYQLHVSGPERCGHPHPVTVHIPARDSSKM